MAILSKLLTVEEVAELFHMTPQHIYRLAKRENGLLKLKIGGAIRFDQNDIEKYINAIKVKSAARPKKQTIKRTVKRNAK